MKNTLLISVLITFSLNLTAQNFPEKKLSTDIKNVTVFLNGAQITRTKSISLESGKYTLVFTGLSPHIDAKSIQVKTNGKLQVLSVNHLLKFNDLEKKEAQAEKLHKDLESVISEIVKIQNDINILEEELQFLKENRKVGGNDNGLDVNNYRATTAFYTERVRADKTAILDLNSKISELRKKQEAINFELRSLGDSKKLPESHILVDVDVKATTQAKFEISYLMKNAGWMPYYDIRVNSINDPVSLMYKANVHQKSEIDWKEIPFTLSTGEPNKSGVAPILQPYYLNYNIAAPRYSNSSNSVTGIVNDANTGTPIPGVNVVVKGSTIGTITDLNGRYELTLPANANTLVFSFIGYISEETTIYGSNINIFLREDVTSLEEVVVRGYGSTNAMSALQGKVAGVAVRSKSIKSEFMEDAYISAPITMQVTQQQTTASFEVKEPYTIPTDGKNYGVHMTTYEIPASYTYFCAPKVDADAFLIAHMVDWEKYNLLEGESNLFFEDTYVGKSILDIRYAGDTLDISLGRDKNVKVTREKNSQFTQKKLLGSKKEETRSWTITIKNNKSQSININIEDQVPVSTNEEIEVTIDEISKANFDKLTGKVIWNLNLKPGEKKELLLQYTVKYPKSRVLNIE